MSEGTATQNGDDDKESLARAHLPFRAEYCKTSRARCKKCSQTMEQDTVKLANLVKSRFHDGYDSNFYHVTCFFQIKRPTSVAEIRNFETLKYEDQKLIEKAVETNGLSVLGSKVDVGETSGTTKISKKKTKKRATDDGDGIMVNYDDFLVEYAKSNRAKCNLCEEKIEKDSVRLGKLDYEAETHWKGGPVPRWFHIECFVKSMDQLGFYGQVDKIKDFDELEEEDQKILKKKVKPIKPSLKSAGSNGNKKPKVEKPSAEDEEEERLLKKQSDRFFALREFVDTMKRKDIELLLESMRQKKHFKSPSMLIDMATDVLLFGPLAKCPVCKHRGGISLRGSSYICSRGTEWESCSYETREPKRCIPEIPDELLEKYPFFNESYKFIGGKRLFSSKFIKAVEQKEAEDNNIVQNDAPLDGLTFGVISWKGVKLDKTKVTKKIITLGGKVQTALDKTLFVILTSEEELAKDAPKVEVAKALNVPFASADFLFKVEKKEDVVTELSKCILDEWKGDIQARINKLNVKQLKSNIKNRSASHMTKSIYKSSSVPKSQSLVIKDGTAVDPDSGYEEVGKVYRKGTSIYSVVLNCVDVAKDKNSFYKMQIIAHETKNLFFLFRSWGRIGCSVGGNTCQDYKNVDEAIEIFENLFEERTGNTFSNFVDGSFKRVHGFYFPVELDYSDPKNNDENDVKLAYSSESKLDRAVQELICFLFDIQRMQRAMKQFELDAEKMPLGKLSQKHIREAMSALKDLEEVLEVKPPNVPSKRRLMALTNKFYSHIPQSFGDGEVQLIDSLKQIDEKNQMLAGLSEIEVAFSMCSTINKKSEQLPVDQHYMKLNCSMSALDHESPEFTLMINYIQQTHAITHSNYKLVVKEVFKVQREEDMKRFKAHKEQERALLFHGSRTTNYAGILSQGLRIAPPEAPTTGYMFGKGIYFADMSSKAANYCLADRTNDVGLLLLCEVALGKAHEVFKSDADLPKGLPDDCQSVKGVGKSMTNPKTHQRIEDNLLVPIGEQKANKAATKSQLLYNEYIVYKESQVMIRYIIQADFVF